MQLQKPALVAEQHQKLSPRMLQSLRLMSLPLQELSEEIRTELEANPALEVIEDTTEISLEGMTDAGNREPSEASEEWLENSSDPGYSSMASPDDDSRRMFMEGTIARPETLQEHLLIQLGLQPIDAAARDLGERLIQNLDSDGFHKTDPGSLRQDCDPELLARAMDMVRRFEPVGTCTSGYKESLEVQILADPSAPPEALGMVRQHLDALERGKHTEVRRALGLKEERYQEILEYLRGLNPFPGRAFSVEPPRYVIPDLSIRMQDGEFVITLNDETIPVLGINPFFDRLSAGHSDKPRERAAGTFARNGIERAKFFIRSIQQRNSTLVKTARAIVDFQRGFFLEGPRRLSPLTLRDVADEIGMHETTVSRVVNGKYIQTDWGIYELRRFFTNSISGSGSGGSSHSKESVKEVIREILSGEQEGQGALSDREIMEVLARRGIRIARRTVAKYRGELDLDSSFARRKG